MEELRFSLKRKQVRVVLEGEEGEEVYILKELTGKGRDAYMSMVAKRVVIGPDGKPSGMKSIDGMATKLLSLSLHTEVDDKLVPVRTIEGWPSGTVEALDDKAREISSLTTDSMEQAGND